MPKEIKTMVVEVEEEVGNDRFTLTIYKDFFPSFQKSIVAGAPEDTIVDFRFTQKEVKEIEKNDQK